LRAQGLCLRTTSMPIEASRKYFGVIENNQVARPKQARYFPKPPVLDAAISWHEPQHPRIRPLSQGLLSDQLLGKIVVKL
jgi:hypothetical protein